MPNLGGGELVVILLILVLLFGARKLPDLGSSIGRSIKNFKQGVDESRADDVPPAPASVPPVLSAGTETTVVHSQATPDRPTVSPRD